MLFIFRPFVVKQRKHFSPVVLIRVQMNAFTNGKQLIKHCTTMVCSW